MNRTASWLTGFLSCCLTIMLASAAESGQTFPAEGEIVWHWYAQCADSILMKMEVSLDGKQLIATLFDMCQMPRHAIRPEFSQKLLNFDLNSKKRSFFGEQKGKHLKGRIWEAGEDKNDFVLGVSFTSNERVWCNTLHILDPEKPSQSTFASGLVIKTFPISKADLEKP